MEIRRLRRQESPPPLPHGGQSRPTRRRRTKAHEAPGTYSFQLQYLIKLTVDQNPIAFAPLIYKFPYFINAHT